MTNCEKKLYEKKNLVTKEMSDISQSTLDHLYMQIYAQHTRYSYFNNQSSSKGVWNKSGHEKGILDRYIELYKNYYRTQALKIRTQIESDKDYNVSSYLTYDPEYYVNLCNDRVEEITKYLVELDNLSYEDVLTKDLSSISSVIDNKFGTKILSPSMLDGLRELETNPVISNNKNKQHVE